MNAVTRPSWFYRIEFAIGALMAVVALAFFFIGLADGSVSSFNMALWLGLLAGIGVILYVGHLLHSQGHPKAAAALLALLAMPGLLYGLFILLLLVSGTSWN